MGDRNLTRPLQGFRCDVDVESQINREAAARGLTKQRFLEQLVLEGLDALKPVDEFRLTKRD